MSMLHRISLSALFAGAAASLLSAPVAAAPARDVTELRLTLEAADGEAPTHVCVLTTHGDPDSTLAALNKRGAHLCSREWGAPKCGKNLRADAEEFYFSFGDTFTPSDGDSKLLGIRGLSFEENAYHCDYGPGSGCLPLFTLRGFTSLEEAHLTCVANQADRAAKEEKNSFRGLMLSLTTQQEEARPFIKGLQLNGTNLLITTRKTTHVDHVVRVLGGFYAPLGEAQFPPESQGQPQPLPLQARCQWTTITIPRITSLKAEAKPAATAAGAAKPAAPGEATGAAKSAAPGEATAADRARPAASASLFDIHLAIDDDGSRAVQETARVGRVSGTRCVSALSDTALRVLLPYEPQYRKRLVIRAGSTGDGDRKDGWELETSWLGPRPPPGDVAGAGRLSASVRLLTFSWRADTCLYPQGACPEAKISASGLGCEILDKDKKIDPTSHLCRYRCTASPDSAIDFPTRIAFSRAADSSPSAAAKAAERATSGTAASAAPDPLPPYLQWSIDIRSVDQQLEGYVDSEERAVLLNTADWDAKPGEEDPPGEGDLPLSLEALREFVCPLRRRDDVFYIEFWTGDRKRHRVELRNIEGLNCGLSRKEARRAEARAKQRREQNIQETPGPLPVVRLPRVSCDEPISYRYVGERAFRQDAVIVKDGELRPKAPMQTARTAYFALTLLPVSFQRVLAPADVRRGSALLYLPTAEASVVFRPTTVRGWRFAVDATLALGPRPYLPLGDTDGTSSPDTERRLYARWYLGPSFLSPWIGGLNYTHYTGAAIAFGAGAQLGLGHLVRRADVHQLGLVDVGLVALRFDMRVRLHRNVEVTFSPRLLLADPAVRFITDLRGEPRIERTRATASLVFPLGLTLLW